MSATLFCPVTHGPEGSGGLGSSLMLPCETNAIFPGYIRGTRGLNEWTYVCVGVCVLACPGVCIASHVRFCMR